MTKGILCAIDFSDASKEALRWAIDQARKLHKHLTVLYTYRLLQRNVEGIELKKNMENEALKKFSALEGDLLLNQGITYDFKTEVGFVADRVKDHTNKNEVDFFVIGKNNGVDTNESLNDLIKKVDVPLVIVP